MSHSRLVPLVLAAVAFTSDRRAGECQTQMVSEGPHLQRCSHLGPALRVCLRRSAIARHRSYPIALSVPVGVSVVVTYVDNGFNGYGEAISVGTNSKLRVTSEGVQTQISGSVPADISMPVQVKVAPANGRATSITGKTNTVISVNATKIFRQLEHSTGASNDETRQVLGML